MSILAQFKTFWIQKPLRNTKCPEDFPVECLVLSSELNPEEMTEVALTPREAIFGLASERPSQCTGKVGASAPNKSQFQGLVNYLGTSDPWKIETFYSMNLKFNQGESTEFTKPCDLMNDAEKLERARQRHCEQLRRVKEAEVQRKQDQKRLALWNTERIVEKKQKIEPKPLPPRRRRLVAWEAHKRPGNIIVHSLQAHRLAEDIKIQRKTKKFKSPFTGMAALVAILPTWCRLFEEVEQFRLDLEAHKKIAPCWVVAVYKRQRKVYSVIDSVNNVAANLSWQLARNQFYIAQARWYLKQPYRVKCFMFRRDMIQRCSEWNKMRRKCLRVGTAIRSARRKLTQMLDDGNAVLGHIENAEILRAHFMEAQNSSLKTVGLSELISLLFAHFEGLVSQFSEPRAGEIKQFVAVLVFLLLEIEAVAVVMEKAQARCRYISASIDRLLQHSRELSARRVRIMRH